MWNRAAISSPVRLLTATAIILSLDMAMAAPDLKQACQPYVSAAKQAAPEPQDPVPFGDAVFWRIEKDDRTSYMLGTMHSQDRMVTNLSPRQRLLLARSKRLLMEVVPNAEANQTYAEAIYSDSGPGLQQALPAVLYERLAEIATDYGLSRQRLDQLEPWAAFSQLGRPKPVSGPTQDRVIYETAVGMGKPVIGLETMAELTDALASLPYDDQITILKDTICNHSRIIRESKTLLDLYLAGDLAGLVAFNNQPHYDEAVFDRFMDAVLKQRNQRMFERLSPYLDKGDSFIAIGALHLPDDGGLLQRIEQAGYDISPVKAN